MPATQSASEPAAPVMNIGRAGTSSSIGAGTSFTLGALANGDVVFIYSRPRSLWGRVSRFINIGGQRLLAAVRRVERISLLQHIPGHSHVMLGIGGGIVIHADGKRVSIDVISEVIRPEMEDAARFVVYRHQQLPDQSAAGIVKAAYRYYNQSYGFTPYFGNAVRKPRRKEDPTQFCSRLVAHAYRAAGHPLTTLSDNRVLPVDLYRICQGAEWRDVTAEFVDEGFPDEVTHLLSEAGLDEIGGMSLQDFLKRSEQTMREVASNQRDLLRLQHQSLRDRLNVEATLAKYVSLQLDVAKASMLEPDSMDERVAGWVKSVLAQLPALLDLTLLPDVEVLITRSPDQIMIAGEMAHAASAFIGMPTPAVVQQMRVGTEVIRIYAYLLLANLGMLAIASRLTNDAKLGRFAAVGMRYGEQFLTVVPLVDDLGKRETQTREGFLWVESESDRERCRGMCDTIIKVLQLIDLVRRRDPGHGQTSE